MSARDGLGTGGIFGLDPTEVRVTDPNTGGKKGQKIQRYDLVPEDQMDKVAELYGKGALKYESRNWEKGYDWSLSYASARRHMKKFWQDHESLDPETGCHHLACAIFHLLALMRFEEQYPEKDDRSPYTKKPVFDQERFEYEHKMD